MQYYWLNKQNNNKLIIFFAGWSFDAEPFKFLACNGYDVLIFFDYNIIEMPDIVLRTENYKEEYLISWSMGVFAAYQLREKLPQFTKKIAINGTVIPVDNELGIPEKPFLLTLRHARTGLESKFYQNIFLTEEEFEKYTLTPVKRTIDNRVEELKSLYNDIKIAEKVYFRYYDKALISTQDRIIPTNNQINFWSKNDTEYKMLESGHFPYYNFENWNDIICN